MKIQNKNEELTNILEEIYFVLSSDLTTEYDQTYKAISNVMTHYTMHDIRKVECKQRYAQQ